MLSGSSRRVNFVELVLILDGFVEELSLRLCFEKRIINMPRDIEIPIGLASTNVMSSSRSSSWYSTFVIIDDFTRHVGLQIKSTGPVDALRGAIKGSFDFTHLKDFAHGEYRAMSQAKLPEKAVTAK